MSLGGTIVTAAVLAAVLAPVIAPWDPYQQDLLARLKPGFWSPHAAPGHLLGTDNYGRDLLSRLVYGSRLSILVGVSSMLFSALVGSVAGVIAGLRGGATEQVIMRFADAQMAFPDILLAILMTAALGGSALNLILVLGVSRASCSASPGRCANVPTWRRRRCMAVATPTSCGSTSCHR